MHMLGLAGMPRRIPDFPDAYAGWNQLASAGSWITVMSMLIFFYVCYDVLTTNKMFTSWDVELRQVVHTPAVFQRSFIQVIKNESSYVNRSSLWVLGFLLISLSTQFIHVFANSAFADSPENYQWGFQDPASPVMAGIVELFFDVSLILIVVVVLVMWVLFRTVYLYNSNRNDYVRSEISHSIATPLEILWTVLPAIVLLIVAVPTFALLYSTDELIDPTISLKVIGSQWYWNYEYSDYVNIGATSSSANLTFESYMVSEDDLELGQFRLLEVDNRVVLPARVHVRVLVTASDVLHSWTVPSLGVKIDATPGRLNQINLFIDRPGVFYGQCSEICGINHGFMPIVVEGVSFDAFTNWIYAKSQEV